MLDYSLDSLGSGWEPVTGFYEYGHEPSGSEQDGEFPD
jgi:hypothetical protein